MPLSEVSHTGVLLLGQRAIVGTDDGQITAVDIASGEQAWSVDVGDHVLAAMAGTDDLVLASVRPEAQGSASLVALHVNDGSEAWRFQPTGAVLDLGSPSVGGDIVYVVASDGSLRAVAVADGAERWAARLYTPTAGSPPAVNDTRRVRDGSIRDDLRLRPGVGGRAMAVRVQSIRGRRTDRDRRHAPAAGE